MILKVTKPNNMTAELLTFLQEQKPSLQPAMHPGIRCAVRFTDLRHIGLESESFKGLWFYKLRGKLMCLRLNLQILFSNKKVNLVKKIGLFFCYNVGNKKFL